MSTNWSTTQDADNLKILSILTAANHVAGWGAVINRFRTRLVSAAGVTKENRIAVASALSEFRGSERMTDLLNWFTSGSFADIGAGEAADLTPQMRTAAIRQLALAAQATIADALGPLTAAESTAVPTPNLSEA